MKTLKWIGITVLMAMLTVVAINGSLADDTADNKYLTIVQSELERNGSNLQEVADDRELLPATDTELTKKTVGLKDFFSVTDKKSNTMNVELSVSAELYTAENVLDHIVVVTNTGNHVGYIRTWFAFEMGDLTAEEFRDAVVLNRNASDWTWEAFAYGAEFDGKRYAVVRAEYKGALNGGETTPPSLLQILLRSNVANDIAYRLDGNHDGKYEVRSFSQAVSDEGAWGAVGDPWENPVIIYQDDQAKFLKAHKEGKQIIICTDILHITEPFDGKGAEVALDGIGDGRYSYLAFAPGKGKNTSLDNLSVVGSGFVEMGHYQQGGGTYTVNNLTIKNLNATLCIKNGSDTVAAAFTSYGKATLTDCVMTGTTANIEGYTAYDAGFPNGTQTLINGGKYGSIYIWHQAKVTIINAKIDYIRSAAFTYRNMGNLTIGAGAEIGTIRLGPNFGSSTYTACIDVKAGAVINVLDLTEIRGADRVRLNIEDGATIGAFVDNGVEYKTFDEWKAAQ